MDLQKDAAAAGPPTINVEAEKRDGSVPLDLKILCRDAFEKAAEYMRGDLAATAEDYKLLEQMNRITIGKYAEMKQIAGNINHGMTDINEKYRNLQPYLDQIDQIEESVSNLEQATYRLDNYSKRLEAKFKQLEKR
ncbi:biogenesis of lysosome-related organelles complex 1 subunit 2-like isoform X2 [Tubulanus polymorphus]|uniref:biogenesis of lysosome-related organelles complex 1 subunit 2-like isoform X2 n=1 Tax=Tubulanus polymorphus TaxID=672921 RepID=UPI003DA2DD4E